MNILDLTYPALARRLADMGEPRFRADQVWQWLWARRAREFSAMTNLSKALRAALADEFSIAWPRVTDTAVSQDGTTKFLLRLEGGAPDDALIETVLIPEADHITQCLSTQVGCAMGCAFCATGSLGFERNMSHAEMAGQVLVARQYLADQGRDPTTLRNLVFMGMGEPLANLDTVLDVLATLGSDTGPGFSSRRMTVSTVGLPAGLERFGESGLASLAVSLHAPTQQLRAQIMPKAARVPLPELIEALERYPLAPRQRITIEYVLLGGVNDSPEHARELVRLLARVKCKINLIAYNPGDPESACATDFRAPDEESVLAFQSALWDKGMTAVLRKSKGRDIAAACGQLRATAKNRPAAPQGGADGRVSASYGRHTKEPS